MIQNKIEIKYRAYKFSITIIKYISTLPKSNIYWIISDQLLRSATSIGANIAEAIAASSRKDFINYYHIALKSAIETKYWLGVLRDATEANKQTINDFLKEAEEITKIISACILSLKRNKKN